MGLIQNGYRDAHGCLKFAGAGFSSGAIPATHHYNFHQTGRNRNLFAGEGITDDKVSVPVGYRPHYCWIMAQKTGGLGSTARQILGSGATGSVNLAGGLNAESTIEGVGGIGNAEVALIMFAQALLSGSSEMSAPATAALNMAIELAGSCSVSAEIRYAESKNMIAELMGMSSSSVNMGALVGAEATLSGQGGVCCSTPRADGFMSADIAPSTTTAASVIAQAVWDYMASQADNPGSMGEAVLAAGGGLVPPSVEEIAEAIWRYTRG